MIPIAEEIREKRTHLAGGDIIAVDDGMVIVPDISGFRRVLAVGDIHGMYGRLRALFSCLDYKPQEDLLVFLGDYIDRGPDSAECLLFIMQLAKESSHVITLTGNHEAMMLDYFREHSIKDAPDPENGWLRSGGAATFESLRKLEARDASLYRAVLRFVLSLNHIAAAGDEFLFCHAGFLPAAPYAQQVHAMLWVREDFFRKYDGRETVVIGHTPVQFFRDGQYLPLVFRNRIIDCDTGSFMDDGRITGIDVRTLECWQGT